MGHRRIPESARPAVARLLPVSLEELFTDAKPPSGKRGPASQLQRSFDRIRELPRRKQKLA